MKWHFLITAFLTLLSVSAFASAAAAQEGLPAFTGTPDKRCFTAYNSAPYNIHGSFYSDFFMTQYGTKGRNQSNFKLAPGERMDHCSDGPFIGPQKDLLYFVLRTLIPVFSCHIRAEDEIIISGRRKLEGGTESWATCVDK